MQELVNELRLTAGTEKVLGIPLGKVKDMKEYWESLIAKMKRKLDIWKSRDLSLEGRSYLIKSIAVSQILYAIEMQQIDEKNMLIKSIKLSEISYGVVKNVRLTEIYACCLGIWEA